MSPPTREAHAVELSCPDPCKVEIDRGTRWEPSLAISPKDSRNLVAASMDQAFDPLGIRYSRPLAHTSRDGGATWTTLSLPMGPTAGAMHPLSSFNHADDGTVLFLDDGTLLYAALVFTHDTFQGEAILTTPASVAVWRSRDGGATFPDAQVVAAASGNVRPETVQGYVENDKEWLSSDGHGGVLMAWNQNERGSSRCPRECTRLVWSWSADQGATWSAPATIFEGSSSGAFPLVLDDGTWVVSYRDTSEATIRVSRSADRGGTWNTNASIDATTKFPVLARASAPGGGERVVMAYPRSAETQGQPDVPQDVVVRWSDDGGLTWTPPILVYASAAQGRTSPALAAVEGGMIVTFWKPSASIDGASLAAAFISRGGAVSSPLFLDTHEGPMKTTGDYMGLAAPQNGHEAFAVWNARHGAQSVIGGARITLLE